MFNFFKSKKKFELLDLEIRKWIENNMLWLEQEFPEPLITDRKIFIPTDSDLPIQWNGSKENVKEVLNIIARSMHINPEDIELDYFDNGLTELNSGGSTIFIETNPEDTNAAGLYQENESGKFEVSLDIEILDKPEALVATLAHELCHVKLLGEKRLEENDEHLTDLTTVFFGFGIFNANTAFEYHQSFDRWGYSKSGYLRQEEWAYALALLAYMREEDNPEWSKYLNKTIKKDFERSLKYMLDNEQEIFEI